MAYLSSTSTAPNPPALVDQQIARSSSNVTGTAGVYFGIPREWYYASTHGATEVVAANFFTDGRALGMRVGDIVNVYGSTFAVTCHRVIADGTTTIQLSAGTIIGSS